MGASLRPRLRPRLALLSSRCADCDAREKRAAVVVDLDRGSRTGLRIVALETRLPLTTDYWRYLWDGRVSNAGINPFRYPPNAPELRYLRDKNWEQIWHKEVPTIYPPTAELLFAGVARVRPSDPELFRWAFVLFDMASVLLLISLLTGTGRPPERVIWYAWCPLPITETAIGLHVDGFGDWTHKRYKCKLQHNCRYSRGSRVHNAASE